VMSLTFGSSLRHLLHSPRLYGLTWDAEAGSDQDLSSSQVSAALRAMRADPDVSDAQRGDTGIPLLIDGVQADGLAVVPGVPSLTPPIIQGRAPSASDEIVLGPKTLHTIKAKVGDTVQVS